ncbi:peptidase family M28 [Schizothecium vesticola]|uniref:Peptide hydrolase n=1 Tax=Schizothecium vesticola TaxID=314040 RepID=A0AA40K920_9PEZI|nr:peptidase family M28 [Schizothecium vesticola]
MKLTTTILLVTSFFTSSTVADQVDDALQARLRKTLTDLEAIARQNGDNRAAGYPGYRASLDYMKKQIDTRFANSYTTWIQEFQFPVYNVTLETLKGPDGDDVIVKTPNWSANTTGITGSLFDTPVSANGSMCTLAAWDGLDPTGKIAFIQRGTCSVSSKARFAKEKGAIAVIIYNQPSNTTLTMRPSVELDSDRGVLPVGLVTREVGEAWKQRLVAGEDLKVTLAAHNTVNSVTSWNLLAQSRTGDPNNAILSGAHLDSVPEGPGIEDNGSGSAALLEVIDALSKYTEHKNALQFAWWGAEELGLLGSDHYVNSLTEAEAAKLKLYFNYDMVGAIGPDVEFGIQPKNITDNGPAKRMVASLEAAGIKPYLAEGAGNSDYAPFQAAGFPFVSLYAGGNKTGECYHTACDDITVIGFDTLALSVKAATYALEGIINSLEGVPLRRPRLQSRTVTPATMPKRLARRDSHAHHQHSSGCAHSASPI